MSRTVRPALNSFFCKLRLVHIHAFGLLPNGTIHFALYSHFNDNLGLALSCQPAYWCCFKNFSVLSQFNCLKTVKFKRQETAAATETRNLRPKCQTSSAASVTQIAYQHKHRFLYQQIIRQLLYLFLFQRLKELGFF